MVFCSNCGKHIDNDVKFCPECGTANESATISPQIQQPGQSPSPPPGSELKDNLKGVAANLREKAQTAAEKAKEKAQIAADRAQEKLKDVQQSIDEIDTEAQGEDVKGKATAFIGKNFSATSPNRKRNLLIAGAAVLLILVGLFNLFGGGRRLTTANLVGRWDVCIVDQSNPHGEYGVWFPLVEHFDDPGECRMFAVSADPVALFGISSPITLGFLQEYFDDSPIVERDALKYKTVAIVWSDGHMLSFVIGDYETEFSNDSVVESVFIEQSRHSG
jgi:ElaB/YqjD/DUF883 family membrane-anchored ribosome-binding protein